MKKILERLPFFLILLPAFVAIHLEKELQQVISYRFVYDRIVIFFITPLLLFALIFFLKRNTKKSAILALSLSFPFFYFGDIKNWLSIKFPESIGQSYSFLLSLTTLILIFILYKTKKTNSDFRQLFLFINSGLMLFIVADLLFIVLNFNNPHYKIVQEPTITTSTCDSCEKPDIYYIVVDTYTSSNILLTNFNYSNSFIEADLKSKGFFIISNSKSNYSYTAFSIGSTLNMNYYKKVDTINKIFDREYLKAIKNIYKNRLFEFLKSQGYQITNNSLFDIESIPSSVYKFDNWKIRDLYDQYNLFFKMKQDLGYHLPKWAQHILWKNSYSITDPKNRQLLDSNVYTHLEQSISFKNNEPKFVYAHFLKPHPPYGYDSLGVVIDTKIIGVEEAYIHQIASSNILIRKVTDSILANSSKPLVIIIQGDHGTPITNQNIPAKKLNNFNAIYFSDKEYGLLNDSITNVNTFRIILNKYFNTNLPMLPDQFYIFKD